MQGSHRVSKANASLLQRNLIPPLLSRTEEVEGVMPASLGHNPGKEKVKSGCLRKVAPGSGALSIAVAPRWSEWLNARKPPSIKGERFASPAQPDPSAPTSHGVSSKG
ncbi:hypothetical protein [Paenibacillus xylanexedens]|uniref:hypothetical protein n=1 Tax=Paenibacillus xylanexedens TaxID=528191 RepID=UPI0011AA5786|nr:hypothetical protein [Paenibacillus xylanexedens]